MRQILITVVVWVILNLLLPSVWERVMSTAPTWALNTVLFIFSIGCVAAILFAQPMYEQWRHPGGAPLTSTLIVSVAFAILAGSAWWFFVVPRRVPSSSAARVDSTTVPEASTSAGTTAALPPAAKLSIVLRQASSGKEIGVTYFRPESWFWLVSDITVINRGATDDTISFELLLELQKGVTTYFSPLTRAPTGINLPAGARLFGVERVPVGIPITGSLLFELPRHQVPEISVQGTRTNLPDIRQARIKVRSEISGLEQLFTEPALLPIKR